MKTTYKFIYEEQSELTSGNESDLPPAANELLDTFQANRNCVKQKITNRMIGMMRY